MKTTLALLVSLALSLPAQARLQIKSEFQLHLTEALFDNLINDFWQSLQGHKQIPAGNVDTQLTPDLRVQVIGLNVDADYFFPVPQRVDPEHREWELKSDKLSATVSATQLNIMIRTVIHIPGGGTGIGTTTVTCNNVSLHLPEGSAKVSARVRAEVENDQIQLSMPDYNIDWNSDSWQLNDMVCAEALQGDVKTKVLEYLSSFENLHDAFGATLNEQFARWSKDVSLVLMSEQEIPTGSEQVKMFYEPKSVTENRAGSRGLVVAGKLRFEYPFVAKDQEIVQDFPLPEGTALVPQEAPQLLAPFAALRALMMGQYFSGALEYVMRSPEIPSFQSLMQSRWKQLYAWPDLMRYPKDTTFLFQFQPLGPPSFENEKAGEGGTIQGDLTMPLSIRMFSPIDGIYSPYVEFRTRFSGPTTLSLGEDGSIRFKINSSDQEASYAFAQSYIDERHPVTRIAIHTIARASASSLSTEGLNMTVPNLTIGKNLKLVPQGWNLQQGNVLKLNFNLKVGAKAADLVRTSNGKKLNVRKK
ncbi:MAG TPA: hypothetical protein VIH99_12335 [Bdellovibrionota bacterium]|jgi:hypothetical protein